MNESDIYKTAFLLPFGHYEFLRMPFSLSVVPKIFMKAITMIFENVDCVNIFVDDILISSKTEE